MDQIQESLNLLTEKLEGWLHSLVVMLPNILIAAVVLGLGYLATGYVRKWVSKLVNRFSSHRAVNSLVTNILTALFMIAVLILVLSILNLSEVVTTVVAGAGVAGLAIGLALQDPIMNLFSGVMMSTKAAFRIGDLIETNDYFGTITDISLRSTILITPQGEEVLIPNKDIYKNPLKNFTVSRKRRVDLSCGVSYGDDLKQVREVAIKAIEQGVKYDDDKPVELFYDEFGDSSINFKLRFWLQGPSLKDYMDARSEAMIALKNAFDEHDIMIPFPIRTLDFGIRGGEKLNDVLEQEMTAKSNGQEN